MPGRSPGKGWILPCDTAKGFGAAAICDRLLGDMNAPAGGGGAGERLGRIRSQQLTQPPNPRQPNSTPIQCTFPECFLCARARELLGAADFQAFGRKKTAEIGKDAHTSPSLLYFLPSVCQPCSSDFNTLPTRNWLPFWFLEAIQPALFSLSAGHRAHSNSKQAGSAFLSPTSGNLPALVLL